jgi:hypothetical protein
LIARVSFACDGEVVARRLFAAVIGNFATSRRVKRRKQETIPPANYELTFHLIRKANLKPNLILNIDLRKKHPRLTKTAKHCLDFLNLYESDFRVPLHGITDATTLWIFGRGSAEWAPGIATPASHNEAPLGLRMNEGGLVIGVDTPPTPPDVDLAGTTHVP